MQIDNYEAALELTSKLQASVPFHAYPTGQALKKMQQEGEQVTLRTQLTIERVDYATNHISRNRCACC